MVDQAVVGAPASQSVPVGNAVNLRAGQQGDLIVSKLHGALYEANYRGSVFFGSGQNTALASTNATATGLTATATPIIGVYNPGASLVNMEILKATINITTVANTAVNPTGFYWVGSTGNNAVSTGSNPVNARTLAAAGSAGKFFHVGTALTGLTNNLTILRVAEIGSINAPGNATAVTLMQGVMTEFVEGGLIAIPGAVLGIMNQVSITTLSVAASLVWQEVPV